ncbi:alpha/beta-hydrolase [Ceraceosorus guamensis]|uniref:Alpha/beta-hydrolase n=1 Tax=Ceraceosorus guamensis TaxID=1522189 RepID=A0A316VV63_9BASI|nr:alpha/beta-hydrolase [Ceraceosorus guamensis]PWN39365.1 alpha/beta-hydrolase [Ceraceosorus guamensis]
MPLDASQTLGVEVPIPPYLLLPLLKSPLHGDANASPSIPTPPITTTYKEWTRTTHFLPAAFPRAHTLCVAPALTRPTLPTSKEHERRLRKEEFGRWKDHWKGFSAQDYFPARSEREADETAQRLAQEQQSTPLWNVVQRWCRRGCEVPENGLILIAAHANGMHKETFEPCLEALIHHSSTPIAEIWSLDTIDSGFSGVVNEGKLGPSASWCDQARDLLNLIHHLPEPGQAAPDVLRWKERGGFAGTRPIVGIGHSYSGSAVLRLASAVPTALDGIIFIDPVLLRPEVLSKRPKPEFNARAQGTVARRDVFSDRQEAMRYFQSRPFFSKWHPRALQAMVEHGLVPLDPISAPQGAVRLAMHRAREAAVFGQSWQSTLSYASGLIKRHTCKFHAVLMGNSDLITDGFADITFVEDIKDWGGTSHIMPGNHLVVQEQPDKLGEHLATVLDAWYAHRPSFEARL